MSGHALPRLSKEPSGPHKNWAKFVRTVLKQLTWTREETLDFLRIMPSWLKKALRGDQLAGPYRQAFEDKLTKAWDEYRKDKPQFSALVWPAYDDNSPFSTSDNIVSSNRSLELHDGVRPPEKKTAGIKIASSQFLFRWRETSSGRLVGRGMEVKALNAAWAGNAKQWQRLLNQIAPKKLKLIGKPHTPCIIVFNAWAGIGKTALVAKWAADRLAQPDRSGIERYFDWSFYNQGVGGDGEGSRAEHASTSDAFFTAALDFFDDAAFAKCNANSVQKANRLIQLMRQWRTLLILDGLEPLQNPRTGEVRDDGLRALLRGLAGHHGSLCLITTRRRIPELSIWQQTTVPEWQLCPLTNKAGAMLLSELGVDGTETEKRSLTSRVKGHALALTLLGNFLKRAHHGDIRRVDRVNLQNVSESEQGGHALRVIAAYEQWFEQGNCHKELAILRMLGLFDRPATPDCLAALCKRPISGLTDELASLDEESWNGAVSFLAELNLVEEQPWEQRASVGFSKAEANAAKRGDEIGSAKPTDHENDTGVIRHALDTHPLVRQYFARRLKRAAKDVWKVANQRLCEHLEASVPYWPADYDGLQPLYQAIVHGCQAGCHQRVCDKIYRDRILRGTMGVDAYYSWVQLGAASSNLAAVSCLFDHPWDKPSALLKKNAQTWLLGEAANYLCSEGRLTEALAPVRASVARAKKDEDWANAGIYASNLHEIELLLGNVPAALRVAEDALAYGSRSKEAGEIIKRKCVKAHALHQAGRSDEALVLFSEAEEQYAKQNGKEPVLTEGHGFWYAELLLSEPVRMAWRQLLPMQKSQTNNDVHIAACRSVMGRVLEPPTHADVSRHELLNLAFERIILGKSQLICSLLEHSAQGTQSSALHIEAAISAMRKSGMLHELHQGLLTRAFFAAANGPAENAKPDLDEAEQIAGRGPMKLFLADIHLYRARLFHDKEALKLAAKLIAECRYGRRKPELEDAFISAEEW